MLDINASKHLGVVERRVVGIAFVDAKVHCRIYVERVKFFVNFRKFVPINLLRIVDNILHTFIFVLTCNQGI